MPTSYRKTRTPETAYLTIREADWEWRILKFYQTPKKTLENPYGAVLCAVKSPMTYGSWEYGDTYVSDIPGAFYFIAKLPE